MNAQNCHSDIRNRYRLNRHLLRRVKKVHRFEQRQLGQGGLRNPFLYWLGEAKPAMAGAEGNIAAVEAALVAPEVTSSQEAELERLRTRVSCLEEENDLLAVAATREPKLLADVKRWVPSRACERSSRFCRDYAVLFVTEIGLVSCSQGQSWFGPFFAGGPESLFVTQHLSRSCLLSVSRVRMVHGTHRERGM